MQLILLKDEGLEDGSGDIYAGSLYKGILPDLLSFYHFLINRWRLYDELY